MDEGKEKGKYVGELPVDLDEDLSRSGCGHIDLLNRSFRGLAIADFDGGLLLLGNVDRGHCCLSGRCASWGGQSRESADSAESALMESQLDKNLLEQ